MSKSGFKFFLYFLLLFVSIESFSQDGPEAPPTEQSVPISNWTPFLFLGALFLGAYSYKKDNLSSKKSKKSCKNKVVLSDSNFIK
jgi:hypothetical protein